MAVQVVLHRRFVHDDTFISLRYARNLAEHGQITWNLGEYVEGYTNFLHVVMTAGLLRLGIEPIAAVQGINLLAAAVLVLLLVIGARHVAPAPDQTFVRTGAVLAVCATPSIAIWVLGGLETVVVATFLLAGVVALLKWHEGRSRWGLLVASVAFSLAVLTRLDAAVFIAGAGLGLIWATKGTGLPRLWPGALVVAIPAAVAFAHMGWRYGYYGELLPLTFYAKAGLPLSLRMLALPDFLWRAATAMPLVPVALLLAAFSWGKGHVRLLLPPILLHLLYVLWSGGDHMPAARVLVVILAPAGLLLLAAMHGLSPQRQTGIAAVAVVASLTAAASRPILAMDHAAFAGRLVGMHIATNWPQGSTVALHSAGATPFYATDMTYIDMLGLNDPVIARREVVPLVRPMQRQSGHVKGDGAYVLSREPDYIIAGPAEGAPISRPWFLSDVEFAGLPEFARCYALRMENIDYGDAYAARSQAQPRPLVFTYYERICD